MLIVDEFTGRILLGRRYNEGMHQAIEAKEGVEVQAENQTLATITLQNYFRLYTKLSGMTGTAQTEAAELHQIYKLGVVSIPTNRPMIRADQSDLVYKTEEAKFDAVAEDIEEKYHAGQPVLVGTTSVAKSEYLSKLLVAAAGAARGAQRQAARARGADHRPGRAQPARSRWPPTWPAAAPTSCSAATRSSWPTCELRRRGLDPVETREEYEAAWDDAVAEMREQVKAEAEAVKDAGGLYVLGTERHESRRIDNQLRGRSGRQGDPGESRFYLSLADDLMRRFNAGMIESIMNRVRLPDDVPIEAGMVTKAIRSAQTQVEQQNFEIRKNVLKYDEVLNKQRTVIYDERRRVLAGENIGEQIEHMVADVIGAYVEGETGEGYAEDWDLDKLWTALGTLYPVGVRWQDVAEEHDDLSREVLTEAVLADARAAYARREAEIDEVIGAQGGMRELERQVLLQVMDRKWREHLYEMDYLKEGIGLRAMAQRDPLIEYQREGYDMFAAMLEGIKEETVGHLFNVRVQPAAPAEPAAGGRGPDHGPDHGPGCGTGRVRDRTAAAQGDPGGGPGHPVRGHLHRAARQPRPRPDAAASVLPAAFRGTRPADLSYSGPAEDGSAVRSRAAAGKGRDGSRGDATVAGGARPSRNRPCPCGSGRKYKQCHGSPTAARP